MDEHTSGNFTRIIFGDILFDPRQTFEAKDYIHSVIMSLYPGSDYSFVGMYNKDNPFLAEELAAVLVESDALKKYSYGLQMEIIFTKGEESRGNSRTGEVTLDITNAHQPNSDFQKFITALKSLGGNHIDNSPVAFNEFRKLGWSVDDVH